MAAVDVRHARPEEIAEFFRSMGVTFLHPQALPDAPRRFLQSQWDETRSWAAFDGERVAGTLRTFPRQLTVPGADGSTLELTADAVTQVTVAATHRRQGLLRRMLTDSLDSAAARGDAVSILIAGEWPIYGRFGYAPATPWTEITIDRRRAGARLVTEPSGGLRQIDDATALDLLPAVFETARQQRAGQIDRPEHWWRRALEPELRRPGTPDHLIVVHEGPSGIDGAVVWHVGSPADLHRGGAVEVDDLYATNQQAYHALWGYLLGMDIVDTVTVPRRPADEPLPHLMVNGRSARRVATDALWLRILDVPRALGARRYGVADRLCLDVEDRDVGGFAGGRFTLDGGPDAASCSPSPDGAPDLRLSQRALAAGYLGGESLTVHALAGHVTELTPGALGRAERMFRTALQPWLATGF